LFTNMPGLLARKFLAQKLLDGRTAETNITAEAYEAWQFVLMCVHPTPMDPEQLSQLIGSQERRFAKAKIQGFISRGISRDFADASHG
jgi:hypothetical protein